MSQTLYEEAIAEARRLTEMAEQNAKNKIIDAVTPQIKRLIEQELMGSEDEMESDESEEMEGEGSEGDEMESGDDVQMIDLDALSSASMQNPEASDAAPPAAMAPSMPVSPAPAPAKSEKSKSGTSLKMDGGEIEITVGGTKIEIEPADESDEGDDEDLLLDQPVAEALARMIAQSQTGRGQLNTRLKSLSERTKTLRQALEEARRVGTTSQKRRLANIFEALAQEAVTLRKQVILTEKSTGGRTPETKLVDSIIKEMKHMSRRNGKNVFDFLFEAEEEEKDMAAEGGDEGGDKPEADVDVDAIRSAVEDLAGALGMNVSEEEGAEDEGEDEAEGEDDVLSLEMDSPELDELDEMDDEAAVQEMYGEAAKKKPKTEAEKKAEKAKKLKEAEKAKEKKEAEKEKAKKEADKKKMNETVFELDESALRRALMQMRASRPGRRLGEAAVDAAGSFGGGEAGDEMFIDVDEETLLNALADELGTAPKPKVGGAELTKESLRLRRQVADYRKVAQQLQGQLVEMNLFNAKLLYANKLMQNRDLSAKQQRAIVEALDSAKTLREAKLLYKSLTESLNKPTNRGGLTEGRTRVLGSSSQSARSAQPINEAGGNDRWALLAGIKKD
jgi:hypothetical protein